MDNGWIKLYRVLLDKYIWLKSTPEQKVILITLLLMANHSPYKWRWKNKDYEVQPGQFITSLNSIVEKCGKGISTQNVRSALKKFEKLEFLTIQSTSVNSLVTLTNWDEYQPKRGEVTNELTKTQQSTNKEVTKTQQSTNKEVTTNKNDKKEKKEKNDKNEKNITHNNISKFKEKYNLSLDMAGVVNEWMDYKKERRESYKSDRGIKSFITKLRNLSGDDPFVAKQIIEQSFANNYAGIFEVKNKTNNGDYTKNKRNAGVSDDYKRDVLARLLSDGN